jgi:tetratricopeptide (TPR) repeat protein
MRKRAYSGVLAGAALVAVGAGLFRARSGLSLREIEAATGLARLYSQHGDHAAAVKLYRDLMRRTDDAPYVRLGLASAYFVQGDFAAAEEAYRILLDADPDSPVPLFNLALTLRRRGRDREAAALFARFVEIYGEDLPLLADRARRLRDACLADPRKGGVTNRNGSASG